ncbi:hypothetical protein A2U01_0036494, partial [Trifolium medium]|nr:hypothetical protein [Trifolium medium]
DLKEMLEVSIRERFVAFGSKGEISNDLLEKSVEISGVGIHHIGW